MSNTIEYNGYIGTVEYSQEDKCFFGKLSMINDLVTFEAYTADELEINFQEAVDEYLDTCKLLNKVPQKAFKGVFNIRAGSELHLAAVRNALRIGVSLNSYVKGLIEKDTKLSLT
ncbi:MAG: type II toxin-antitoxin system HicB family antitoxin [Campylobacterales bacterium]|nr:type II toxin-antitoxin system HicB family antitoxin [Campylobacterales bacterium]